jgi:hypothetical protein
VPRRRQPGADARGDRNQRKEEIHARVGGHVHRDREADDRRKGGAEPERQQQRDRTCGEAECEALSHQLPDNTSPRGTERQPDADLAAARQRARQLQVRHVHAGEQHHETEYDQDDGQDERQNARASLDSRRRRSRGIQAHA